jgi:hypothetical protein
VKFFSNHRKSQIDNPAKNSQALLIRKASGLKSGDYYFMVLLALCSTLLSYRFASGNQIEQLPMILRQLNPEFLSNDFFLSTTSQFGPRVYFVNLMSWVSEWLSLPWAYAVFTFLSDLALVMVTQWAARNVIGAGRLGTALACVMVLGLSSFHLGDATQLRYGVFQPASLAIPGALWAVGLGLRGRAIAAASVAALSSLPHPLYGAGAGAIALGTAFFALLVPLAVSEIASDPAAKKIRLAWGEAIIKTAVAGAILGIFLTVFWLLPYQEVLRADRLSSVEFFNILAHFRSPHHYLPSYFRLNDYIALAFFLLASGFAFERWFRTVPPRTGRLMLLPVLFVFLGCLGGYLFIEIWPLRTVLSLQPFRMLSIIKWLGFMWMGQVLASYWLHPSGVVERPLVALSVLSGGIAHPIVNFASLATLRFRPWQITGIPEYIWVAAALLLAATLWYVVAPLEEVVFLLMGLGLMAALYLQRLQSRLLSIVLCFALAAGLAFSHDEQGYRLAPALAPQFDFDDRRNDEAKAARAAASISPGGALFITPPTFGLLRVIGQRALVVDFKAIPFQDSAIREWRERILAIYGDGEEGGFAAARKMDRIYRQINDDKLLELAKRYGASHALLYIDTATDLTVLYADENYRIVEL